MAKELGLNPRKLMRNIPSPSQRWKAPVKVWIREIYFKRFKRETLAAEQAPSELQARPARPEETELSETEWNEVWGEEALRRLREIEDGTVKAIPGDEVMARVRAVTRS